MKGAKAEGGETLDASLDAATLAARADVSEAGLARYVDLGLLDRSADGQFNPDSIARIRLIRFAQSRGISADVLAAATERQGMLLGTFVELQSDPDRPFDIGEEAAKAGVDPELLAEVQELMQWEDSAASADDVAALRMMGQALAAGLPRDALLQLVRVYSDFADRLADAENRVFHHYVHDRFRTEGLSGQALLEATQSVSRPLLEMVEPTILYMHRWAFDRAAREDLLRHLTEDAMPSVPGQSQSTVMFVDLASFTPLTAAMGDDSAAAVLRRFGAIVRSCSQEHNGRIVKQIGDAFMLTFMSPDDAVGFGQSIIANASREPQFPALHVGAHHGPVLFREGDYVGATVNLAARIAAATDAGQFLISAHTADMLTDITTRPLPPRSLKGVADPVALAEIPNRADTSALARTDPVCGMRLQEDDVASWVEHEGNKIGFCSPACSKAFTEDPAKYL